MRQSGMIKYRSKIQVKIFLISICVMVMLTIPFLWFILRTLNNKIIDSKVDSIKLQTRQSVTHIEEKLMKYV